MKCNACVSDLNGVFLKKNYSLNGMKLIDPEMYAEAKYLLDRDNERIENVADLYGLYPKNDVDRETLEVASWAITREDYTIKQPLDLIRKQPLEIIIITTNSGPYDTFFAKYKYLDPITNAKIFPFTPELIERDDGLMELNPDSFFDAKTRGLIAKTVAKEYVTMTMGDKEGEGTNDELIISGDVGIEFDDKSKKGFQFDGKQNLFTDVKYKDLPEIEKIIDSLPQPKKKKTGFIDNCLKVLSEENPDSSYAAKMPKFEPRCVI